MVHYHLPNKIRALTEASDLLTPGGLISIHEPNGELSRLPSKLLSWIASPIIRLQKVLRLKENKLSKIKSSDISPYETSLTLKHAKQMLENHNLKILEAKTVWFFGIIPSTMSIPPKLTELYYNVANTTDELLEKLGLYKNKAGAVFIIARAQV